jgi:hypothetical protein
MPTKLKTIFLAATVAALAAPHGNAHDHFAAGIIDTNGNGAPDSGERMQFADGDPENRVFHLLPRPIGRRCGGHYMLDESARTLFPADAFSLTVQSNGDYEIQGDKHPRTGSWIWVEIASLSGPPGGVFSFWEENSNTPTHVLETNKPTGSPMFVISEGPDDPDEDPFGHIHGRAWAASMPGDYIVGLRLVDLSTSGPGGGPWHAPSRIYQFHFRAGPSFQPSIVKQADGPVTLSWPSRMGIWQAGGQTGVVFTILRSSRAEPGSWLPVGSVTGTTADTASFTDPSPPATGAFYRLSYAWATP